MRGAPSRDRLTWIDRDHLEVDGVRFYHGSARPTAPDDLRLYKHRMHAEAYADLLDEFRGGNIVELGIAGGGSAALSTLLAAPARLVALELAPQPVAELTAFIESQRCGDRLRPHYGVDQGDRERVGEILDAEFGTTPLDLVVDDASHLLEPTRVSFETTFPRLRPGGLYCLEDWNWQHQMDRRIRASLHDPAHGALLERALAHEVAVPDSPGRLDFARRLAARIVDPRSAERAAFSDLLARHADDLSAPERASRAQALRARLAAPAGAGAAGALEADTLDYLARIEETEVTPDETGAGPETTEDPTQGPIPMATGEPGEVAPLLAFVTELLLVRAESSDVIASIEVGEHWVRVRRGPAGLDPAAFRLADAYTDRFGLVPR